MKRFVSRRPLLFSILAILVYLFGMQALEALVKLVSGPSASYLAVGLSVQAIFCALLIALIGALGWRREAGFAWPQRARSLLAYAPWLLLVAVMAADIDEIAAGAPVVLGFAVLMLMVGFAEEEALLRGVVLRALLPGGVMRAALVSSIIFGLAHLANVFGGRDLPSTVVQAAYATFIGIGFAGPRLASGTVWPAIVIHALIDFTDVAGRGFVPGNEARPFSLSQAVTVLAITGLYAAYGLWLVRRLERRASAQKIA